MTRYRKNPVVVDAVRWDADWQRIVEWLDVIGYKDHPFIYREGDFLRITTLEGTMTAGPGDWIVRGTEGELYPVKPPAFAATFEPVVTP